MIPQLMPALLIAGALAAEPAKEPPAKAELFAKEGWYKDQKGKEEEFVGVLMFKDMPKGVVGFGRFNPYTLVMGEGAKKTVREVYVGGKPDLLKPYIGKTIKLTGKAVDMEVEGKDHREIWPARLEVIAVVEKKEGKPPEEVRREQEKILKELERLVTDPEEKPDAKELKIAGRAFWRAGARPGVEAQQLVLHSAEELAKASGMPAEEAEKFLAQQFKVEKIDFKTQMIVVATGGAKPTGGYSVEITGLTVADKTLTVKWKLNVPKPGSIVTQAFTHPGQAVLVERFEGTVKFDPPAPKGAEKEKE